MGFVLTFLDTITAEDIETESNKVRIANIQGNSGTVGVEVGDCIELGVEVSVGDEVAVCKEVDAVGLGRAWGFGVVKMGKKFIVPSVKSYLKSYIVWLIA